MSRAVLGKGFCEWANGEVRFPRGPDRVMIHGDARRETVPLAGVVPLAALQSGDGPPTLVSPTTAVSAELCGNLLRSRSAPGSGSSWAQWWLPPRAAHNTIGLMAYADRPDVPSGLASSLVLSEFGLQYAIDRE